MRSAGDVGRAAQAARRQRVRGGAGGRRDDHAVGLEKREELAVDVRLDVDDAPERAAAEHGVVQTLVDLRLAAAAPHGGAQHAPPVDLRLAAQRPVDGRRQVLDADLGQEAEAAQIDADDRHLAFAREAASWLQRAAPTVVVSHATTIDTTASAV